MSSPTPPATPGGRRHRLLLAEDDLDLLELVERVLARAGYDVVRAVDGQAALHLGLTQQFDLAVLDRGLPARDGLEVLRAWRSGGIAMPTLILSAYGTIEDRITGLDAGAEDYLVKPFEVNELLARLRALTRRHVDSASIHSVGRWLLEVGARMAWPRNADRAQSEIWLSEREAALLAVLASRRTRVFTREELLDRVFESADNVNTVDTYVSYCRRKLDRDVIRTVRGVGYQCGHP